MGEYYTYCFNVNNILIVDREYALTSDSPSIRILNWPKPPHSSSIPLCAHIFLIQ